MKKMAIITFLVLACIASISCVADDKITTPGNIDELKQSISELIERYDVPAIGIAMIDENGPVWIDALGKANLENNIDADGRTLFRIASTSKLFVALSVLKLVEEGKLTLQDKLTDLAPDIVFTNPWEKSHPIRLVHLLEHTTGWDEQHYPELAQNDPTPSTLKQDLEFHPHSRQSRWPPGTRFSYTNSGPAVAAYIVQQISGQRFEDYVQEHFFDPIGMTTASYFLSDEVKAKGVTLYASGNQPLDYWHLFMRPSGSINASAMDMAKLLRFFLGRGRVDGNRILSADSLKRMESVESTSAAREGQKAGYGLGNYSSFHKQWVYREHSGGFDGAMSEFAYLPEAKLGHAFMISSKNPLAFRKISELIRDYETRNLTAKVIEHGQTVTDEHRQIEGVYYPINPRMQKLAFLFHFLRVKTLRFEGNTLVQRGFLGGKGESYYPVSESLYRSKETGMTSLSRVVDPLAGEVVHSSSKNAGSGNNVVLKPINSWLGYSLLFISLSWPFVVVTSVGYFLIWFVRKLMGKIPAGATMRVRVWPLLASTSMILIVLLLMAASSDFYKYLSQPTSISIGIMLATASYAVLSLLAVFTVVKERNSEMNRANYWYCAFSSVIHLMMAVYLSNFGVIGIQFWT